MTEDVETVPLKGKQITLDGTNADEVRAFAGSDYIGSDGTRVAFRTYTGEIVLANPGWVFIRWEDGSHTVSVPGAPTIRAAS